LGLAVSLLRRPTPPRLQDWEGYEGEEEEVWEAGEEEEEDGLDGWEDEKTRDETRAQYGGKPRLYGWKEVEEMGLAAVRSWMSR
jgi:hypothetical protein